MSSEHDQLDIDDIFSRLKESIGSTEEESQNKGEALNYEQLKKKVLHLPSIEVNLYSDKEKKETEKTRKIRKINDTVESVIPKSNQSSLKNRRLEKERKSNEWFSLPKVEMTDELKRDLLIIKNRKYLDPKRFYKGEKWEIPTNFQVGEIVNGFGENGGKSLKRKQKGSGMVEELLKDDGSKAWFDKTFKAIQTEKRSGGKKFLKDKIAKRKKY